MADIEEKLRNTEKDINITEDHYWVNHPPPEGMLLLVVLDLNLAVVIPPSTETEQGKTVNDSDIDDNHSQLKNPPEKGMLMPVDPALVNSPSTETEHKGKEPTIAPELGW